MPPTGFLGSLAYLLAPIPTLSFVGGSGKGFLDSKGSEAVAGSFACLLAFMSLTNFSNGGKGIEDFSIFSESSFSLLVLTGSAAHLLGSAIFLGASCVETSGASS